MASAKPPPDHQQLPLESETLNYQTWILKVLIHCDGCTKRINKILQRIEGVYSVKVDSRQHKVTVTGNVEAETLIRKLSRSGKSVEIWPEKLAEKKDKKPSTKSKDEKEDTKSSTEPVGDSGHEDCIDDGEEDSNHNDGGGENKSEGGAKKKKKKKKKNKSASVPHNNDGGEKVIISTEKIDEVVATPKEIIGPPQVLQQQHDGYNPYQPYMYYSHPPLAQAPPPYGLSYNTSYPVASTSYYVGASIMPMHANYSRVPPPSDPINNNYGYHHDHDEYEGGYCSIM